MNIVIVENQQKIQVAHEDVLTLRNKIKEHKAMLKDAYENDSQYKGLMEQINELKRELNGVKKRIDNEPSMQATKMKIDELKSEMKDVQESLFADLELYTRQTGQNTIELNGEIKKIVTRYSLSNQ